MVVTQKMSRCKLWEMWEASPLLSLVALACLGIIVLSHLFWMDMAYIKCHCHHPDYIDNDEHEALATFCIAYYARFCDQQSFSNTVQRCLHDRQFLINWALTHDPIDQVPIEPDSFLGNISPNERESMSLTIMDRKIPLHENAPCRAYVVILCLFHYWMTFPMVVSIIMGAIIAALHVQIYANWSVAMNTKHYRSR